MGTVKGTTGTAEKTTGTAEIPLETKTTETAQTKPASFIPSNSPLCFEYSTSYSYDFTAPQPRNSTVTLHVAVEQLALSPCIKHKFLLLAGDKFDPYTSIVKLTRSTPPEHAVKDEIDAHNNKAALVGLLLKMISTASEMESDWVGIPLDLRHVKPKKSLDFPIEWVPKKEMMSE